MDAEFFRAWIAGIAAVVETQRDHLTQLASAIGGADHGINLARGFGAVQTAPAALPALTAAPAAAAHATIEMQARKGRASYLGPRSVGHEDPGAASSALILGALRDTAWTGRLTTQASNPQVSAERTAPPRPAPRSLEMALAASVTARTSSSPVPAASRRSA